MQGSFSHQVFGSSRGNHMVMRQRLNQMLAENKCQAHQWGRVYRHAHRIRPGPFPWRKQSHSTAPAGILLLLNGWSARVQIKKSHRCLTGLPSDKLVLSGHQVEVQVLEEEVCWSLLGPTHRVGVAPPEPHPHWTNRHWNVGVPRSAGLSNPPDLGLGRFDHV